MTNKKHNPHLDYQRKEVNVGDIVFGAKPSNYRSSREVSYHVSLVIDKTARMLRLHQIDTDLERGTSMYEAEILDSIKDRGGHKGGLVNAYNVIKIRETNIDSNTIVDYLKAGAKKNPNQQPFDFNV